MTKEEVKQIRTARNQTQTEFANDVGCDKSTVVRWEAGGKISRVFERKMLELKQSKKVA